MEGEVSSSEPLRQKEVEQLPPDIAEKLQALETQFPGEVILMKKGQPLYHESLYPERLAESGKFDPKLARKAGYVYFTDIPLESTNIEVTLQDYIFAHDDRKRQLEAQEEQIPRTPYRVLEDSGFQASLQLGSSAMFTTTECNEVVIFPSGGSALDHGISLYKSKQGNNILRLLKRWKR